MSKINNKDAAMVFRQGAEEIDSLRRRIDILQAKSDVIDVFKMALAGKRDEGQGYGEDIAWKLRKAADAIETPPVTDQEPAPEDHSTQPHQK